MAVIIKNNTAAGMPISPNANNATERPILPALTNIMDGTNVFALMPNKRISGNAITPEPSKMSVAASANGW